MTVTSAYRVNRESGVIKVRDVGLPVGRHVLCTYILVRWTNMIKGVVCLHRVSSHVSQDEVSECQFIPLDKWGKVIHAE